MYGAWILYFARAHRRASTRLLARKRRSAFFSLPHSRNVWRLRYIVRNSHCEYMVQRANIHDAMCCFLLEHPCRCFAYNIWPNCVGMRAVARHSKNYISAVGFLRAHHCNYSMSAAVVDTKWAVASWRIQLISTNATTTHLILALGSNIFSFHSDEKHSAFSLYSNIQLGEVCLPFRQTEQLSPTFCINKFNQTFPIWLVLHIQTTIKNICLCFEIDMQLRLTQKHRAL